jgi:hypothetical protein
MCETRAKYKRGFSGAMKIFAPRARRAARGRRAQTL